MDSTYIYAVVKKLWVTVYFIPISLYVTNKVVVIATITELNKYDLCYQVEKEFTNRNLSLRDPVPVFQIFRNKFYTI